MRVIRLRKMIDAAFHTARQSCRAWSRNGREAWYRYSFIYRHTLLILIELMITREKLLSIRGRQSEMFFRVDGDELIKAAAVMIYYQHKWCAKWRIYYARSIYVCAKRCYIWTRSKAERLPSRDVSIMPYAMSLKLYIKCWRKWKTLDGHK